MVEAMVEPAAMQVAHLILQVVAAVQVAIQVMVVQVVQPLAGLQDQVVEAEAVQDMMQALIQDQHIRLVVVEWVY
jgi:hypothetical protein